jgi:hypothetical protein
MLFAKISKMRLCQSEPPFSSNILLQVSTQSAQIYEVNGDCAETKRHDKSFDDLPQNEQNISSYIEASGSMDFTDFVLLLFVTGFDFSFFTDFFVE